MSMQLGPDFVFDPRIQEPDSTIKTVRLRERGVSDLGFLSDLAGKWEGEGFNTIWRPLFDPRFPDQHHFLELNLTRETLQFEVVEGPIPNRGLLQEDIDMYGVHYLQKVTDQNTGEALHFEPGIWLNIPETTQPRERPSPRSSSTRVPRNPLSPSRRLPTRPSSARRTSRGSPRTW